MDKYICFYKNKKVVVEADGAYAAQWKAAKIFDVSPKSRW